MTKTLQSLLEMAVVVAGLAGTPALVFTSLGPVALGHRADTVAVESAQDVPKAVTRADAGV